MPARCPSTACQACLRRRLSAATSRAASAARADGPGSRNGFMPRTSLSAFSEPALIRPASTFCCTITPFNAEGELDEPAWRLLLGRLREAGIGAAIGTASPGEGHALSPAETETLYGIAKGGL